MIRANTNAEQANAAQEPLSACAGLPLVFYVDGKQQGNASEAQQAKAMAASFSRTLSNVEPQVLAWML
jgi:hypothetical protein